MAQSQLELLANSLTKASKPAETKVQAMILYLPQENKFTGQLEFTPAVLYPDPTHERVFIASDAESGQATTLPKSLSILPGFSSAPELIPNYPMLSFATDPGVGVVEEVMCDIRWKTSALSVPLLSGPQTIGLLLVSPASSLENNKNNDDAVWTIRDKEQVSLAAQSLSMGLTMDNERSFLRNRNDILRENLSDSLHQMKNPIQALRTYGKILQRQVAELNTDNCNNNNNDNNDDATFAGDWSSGTYKLLDLTERLMVQSDRVVEMLIPIDNLVETMDSSKSSPVLLPAAGSHDTDIRVSQSMVLWKDQEDSSIKMVQQEGSKNSTLQLHLPVEEDTNNLERSHITDASTNSFIIDDHETSKATFRDEEQVIVDPLVPATTVVIDFETELVFVTDVLAPVFDTFHAIASERGIIFDVLVEDADDLPGVVLPPRNFQEAISNVLDNALKYVVLPKSGSPFTHNPNPKVVVRIFPNDFVVVPPTDQHEQTGVTIVVEDNGPGIADDDRELIFRRRFRSDKTNTVEGRGIGLDIAQSLIKQMGGMLDLVNNNEKCRHSLDGAVVKIQVFRNPKEVF